MKKRLLLSLLAFCLAACGSRFAYKPNAAHDAPKVPLKVAVQAFEDGTEDFTKRGSLFSGYVFNLSRTGINGLALNTGAAFNVSALPAGLWAKAFVEDMRASGDFRSAKLVFGPSELTDEDLVVEGALTQAYFHTKKGEPDEFCFHLKVRRLPGKALVWEGDVRRTSPRPPNLTSGCILGDCVIDRIHGYLNGVMQGMFADARLALVRTLAAPPATKPDSREQDSPEEVIRRILGKP